MILNQQESSLYRSFTTTCLVLGDVQPSSIRMYMVEMVPIVNAPTLAMARLAQVHHNKQSMQGDAALPQAEYI